MTNWKCFSRTVMQHDEPELARTDAVRSFLRMIEWHQGDGRQLPQSWEGGCEMVVAKGDRLVAEGSNAGYY